MPAKPNNKNEFLIAVRNGAVIGAVLLVFALPWLRPQPETKAPVALPPVSTAPAERPAPALRLADFGDVVPSAAVRQVANWAVHTGDAQGRSVVILDKKAARVYALDPAGKLVASAPALLGAAIGDDSAPGIGDKPLSAVLPQEKTTPAGRFLARPGVNTQGEDIVWIDYDAAVSMHRVRATVAAERRLQRLLSVTEADNRISFGCINLPVAFYEGVLSPTVQKTGAIVYVLPETRTPQEVFGSWDVTDPAAGPPVWALAQHQAQDAGPLAPRQERELP